jgi:hypothetical protein
MAPPLLADLPAGITSAYLGLYTWIENELRHPRCRLNLGFENI